VGQSTIPHSAPLDAIMLPIPSRKISIRVIQKLFTIGESGAHGGVRPQHRAKQRHQWSATLLAFLHTKSKITQMKLVSFLALMFLAFSLVAEEPRLRPENWATPVLSQNLDNWHQLDKKVYRASQPTRKGFEDLLKFGIKNVLNLRDNHSDDAEAKGLKIKTYRIEMEADDIFEKDLVAALKIIKNSDGPILIHCWHGSDRTGLLCAMYRIVFQNWTKEAATDELVNGGFGYHAIYKNITKWIKDSDVEALKKKVFEPNAAEIRPQPANDPKRLI
jgi:tyrosine-protein phosphatase SIW14